MKALLARLVSKKPAAAAEAPSRPLSEPAYYEVWGGLESANRALWTALWLAVTVALLCLLLVRIMISTPPVVIRVDAAGNAVLADTGRQPPVSEAEVKNFLTLFERFFTELNVYTYPTDLRQAGTMMTPDFQRKADDMLKRDGTIEKLKGDEGRTTLTITEIGIASDTPQIIECHVKGYRELGSYKADQPSGESVFDDDIILRKVPRSEQTPYGLLVQDFNESLFKRN